MDGHYTMLPIELLNIIFTSDPCTRIITSRLNRYWYAECRRYINSDTVAAARCGDCFSIIRTNANWINAPDISLTVFTGSCPIIKRIFSRYAAYKYVVYGLAYAGEHEKIIEPLNPIIVTHTICHAIYGRHEETVDYLFKYIEHANIASVFKSACIFGIYSAVQKILDMPVTLDWDTGLILASLCGYIDIVKLLIDRITPACYYYIGSCGYSDIVYLAVDYADNVNILEILHGAYDYGRVHDFETISQIYNGPLEFTPRANRGGYNIWVFLETIRKFFKITDVPMCETGRKYLAEKYDL